ncbi:hypothetical protein [Paenibacillus sp. YPG26]|uniref:hypothetical protein n=1 Tax=Paenibacillus sp. YPG26 TaxID=2878915 RepID=UPI002040871D|nr:hypothetical protein [Paenibacillus sp. YPG26]USB33650.1 hypothetical protein LDO05_02145 [Paenibacillus sp. YPG26]
MGAIHGRRLLPRLALFSEEDFRGRRIVFRGSVAIRNIERIFDEPESLRFRSNGRGATLVLFSRSNFRGRFRVIRTSRSIADLERTLGFEVNSIILSSNRLTLEEIRLIRRTGNLPGGFLVI